MRKHMITKICSLFCLALLMVTALPAPVKVQAAETIATVQGSVMAGTTNELLKLSTREGNMEIKIDGGTDASGCKILLPGKDIYVSVSHGSDGYLHAVKITSVAPSQSIALDSTTNATITGTINEKSKDDILCVNTAQGEMQI